MYHVKVEAYEMAGPFVLVSFRVANYEDEASEVLVNMQEVKPLSDEAEREDPLVPILAAIRKVAQ